MLRFFLKDAAIYTVPAVISRGLSLFLVPLYTQVLTPADFGSLDLLMVFGNIINLTIALEVSQGVARFYGTEPDPDRKIDYISSAFWFTLVCYCFFGATALFFTHSLANKIMGQEGLETPFQIGIINICISGIFYLLQNQFRWELRSTAYAIVSLFMSLVTASLSVWLVYGLDWGLQGVLIGSLTGTLAGSGLGLFLLRTSVRFRFNRLRLREMLAFSAPLVFSGVAVWISLYVDRIMINRLLSVDDVGVYGIGYRLSSIAGLVMTGFQSALTPLIYAHYRDIETPHQLARIFRIFVFITLISFLFLTLFAADLLHLLATKPFYAAAAIIVYLVPAIFLSNMYIFSPGITISKKTHYLIWINSCGALLNIILNYFLIPPLGISGAAIATLLGYLSVFLVHMMLSQRLYYVPHQWKPLLIAVIAAAAFAFLVPQIAMNSLLMRWCVNLFTIITFSALSIALGLLNINELSHALSMLRKR